MRIKTNIAAIILPVFFFLGIGFTMINGYWATESSKEPVKFTTGELAGQSNPADIRGSYSLSDIENSFNIPVDTLAKAFGVSENENPGTVQLKVFEEVYGEVNGLEVGTDSMRLFVARYLGLPYTTEEGTGIPQPAFNILKKEGKMSQEELDDLTDQIVALDIFNPEGATLTESETHDTAEDTTVKGNTTFDNLLTWGLTQDQIEEALGGKPMGKRAETVRDYCLEQGIEFSIPKTALQEILDKL
jgi:hypothetical protein